MTQSDHLDPPACPVASTPEAPQPAIDVAGLVAEGNEQLKAWDYKGHLDDWRGSEMRLCAVIKKQSDALTTLSAQLAQAEARAERAESDLSFSHDDKDKLGQSNDRLRAENDALAARLAQVEARAEREAKWRKQVLKEKDEVAAEGMRNFEGMKAERDAALTRVTAAEKALESLKASCSKQDSEIQQILGKALGYPWFKDDQANFPGATEADGVAVGEHVAVTLAMEAAKALAPLREISAKIDDNIGTPSALRHAGSSVLIPLSGDDIRAIRRVLPGDANNG